MAADGQVMQRKRGLQADYCLRAQDIEFFPFVGNCLEEDTRILIKKVLFPRNEHAPCGRLQQSHRESTTLSVVTATMLRSFPRIWVKCTHTNTQSH